LLLVVSFFGHDLLMTAAAVAKTPETAAAHHAPASSAHGATPTLPRLHGPPTEHPENCRIGQFAVPRGDAFGRIDPDLAATPGFAASIMSPAAAPRTHMWREPGWSPGTLRALFQVYRM
jgi:hypothetical protein